MRAVYVLNFWSGCVLAAALAVGAQGASPWTLRDAGTTANLWGATSGGKVVVVGEQGTILTSEDEGATWTRRTSGTTAWLTAVSYSSQLERYFAVGDGGVILSSADAVTWTGETSPTTIRLNGVAADPSYKVVYAFGEAGAGFVMRDTNGVWTRTEAALGNGWLRGIYNGTVVGQNGAVYSQEMTGGPLSQTGTWTRQTVSVTADLEAVGYGVQEGGLNWSKVAVGADGTIIQQDGTDWSVRSSGTTQRLRGICWKQGGGLVLITLTVKISLGEYFAVGANGTILRSTAGVTWQADSTPTQSNLNAVIASGNTVVTVGDGGTILTTGGNPAVPPRIERTPTMGVDANGQVFLEGEGAGDGALTHLWVRVTSGAPWPVGWDHPVQTLSGTNYDSLYVYQLIVANAFGLARSALVAPHRLLDLSGRSAVGSGENILIGGFSIYGTGLSTKRTMLIRAVGPTLADLGVSTPLKTPRLSVFSGSALLATNTGWETNANAADIRTTAASLGAFALRTGSADSALLLQLDEGNYTAQVESADGSTGVALIEIYDADGIGLMHLKNLSARAQVKSGEGVLIGGLVIEGGVPKQVLLRGAGPALTALGVGGVLAQPKLTLFKGQTVVASNAGWSSNSNAATIASEAVSAGAFAFASGSADAALLLTLDPGAYTIQVTGADGGTGVALVEVYEAP